MLHAAVDRRASAECRLDGRFLPIYLTASERGPPDRAAGDEATEQQDQCDGEELDAQAR
jgi:hypothetical protein